MVVHDLQAVASIFARAIAQAFDLSHFVVEASVNALRCARQSLVLSEVAQRRKQFRHDWLDIVRLCFKLLQDQAEKTTCGIGSSKVLESAGRDEVPKAKHVVSERYFRHPSQFASTFN